MKTSGITRRGFLIDGATAFAAAGMPRFVAESDATGASLPLIGSAPVLMNPAERTMDVVFAVNGWRFRSRRTWRNPSASILARGP